MSAYYDPVEARREWELAMIKEKLAQGQQVDTAVCHVERVSSDPSTLRFGLKRGKLLYLFRYPTHDVEREKHRNVIARARYIKNALELDGYRLIPWDFKKDRPPTFWKEDNTMEDDEDDIYGPSETQTKTEQKAQVDSDDGDKGDEPMDEGLESGEEEESDSESDVEFVLDKPQTAPKPVTQTPTEIGSKAIKIEQPPQHQQQQTTKTATASASTPAGPAAPLQSGTDYPPVRTSTIDVNQDPVYPPVGKPVSQIDIDADLAESSKPWRLPGADQSDYFNYGFDEFTWEMYRQKQANMAQTLVTQKAETAQFQQMFSGMGPMPGAAPTGSAGPAAVIPGAPTGPSAQQGAPPMGMPGMPDVTPDQMMAYMQQMQAQGVSPDQLDFSSFMNAIAGAQQGGQGFGGGFGGAGGAGGAQFGGGGAGGGRGGGRRGRGW